MKGHPTTSGDVTGGGRCQFALKKEVSAIKTDHPVSWKRREMQWFLCAVPTLLVVSFFFLVPIALNTRLAFTDWSGFKSEINFIGLDNFRYMIKRGLLLRPVCITVFYAVIVMLLQNITGLFFALALEETNPLNGFFRSVFFIPVLISPVAAGYIWRGLLDPGGPANALFSAILPGEVRIAWLGNPSMALFIVAAVDAWKWVGFSTLVYIAGLNTIPRELKESAKMDGASPSRIFWHIKRPMLAPAFTFNITITLIGSMSAFDVVMATTMGGPGDSTRVLNIVMYQQFGNGLFGFATAATFTVTVMVIAVAIPLVSYLRSREIEL